MNKPAIPEPQRLTPLHIAELASVPAIGNPECEQSKCFPTGDRLAAPGMPGDQGNVSNSGGEMKTALGVSNDREDGSDPLRLVALGLMTAGITHDLGNVIQVVASAIRLIDRNLGETADIRLRPIMTEALASVDRASVLTRRILGFAKSEDPMTEVMNVGVALTSLKDLLRWTAGPAVQFQLDIGEDLPAIACDPHEFGNAILNLIINARDAMAEGGRLTVSVDRKEKSDAGQEVYLELRVRDDGCGMEPETVKRAFDPFFSTKEKTRGTGLGLAMVKSFAQRLNGTVEIDSARGSGTVITMRVPECIAQPRPRPPGGDPSFVRTGTGAQTNS